MYEGDLPLPSFTDRVEIGGTQVELVSSQLSIPLRCTVALWEHKDTTRISEGVYPNEADPIEFRATSEDVPAEVLEQLSIEFEFEPENSESFLRGVIADVY